MHVSVDREKKRAKSGQILKEKENRKIVSLAEAAMASSETRKREHELRKRGFLIRVEMRRESGAPLIEKRQGRSPSGKGGYIATQPRRWELRFVLRYWTKAKGRENLLSPFPPWWGETAFA